MSDRMDTVLREAFDDIASSEPVPDGLAKAALVRARRQRFGRAALIGGAAMACAAAVAVTAVVVPAATPSEEAAGAQRTTVVAFAEVIDNSPQSRSNPNGIQYYSLLLDPKTGKYERMPYWRVRPSPDGARALVWEERPFRVGVWERSTGDVRWFKLGYDVGRTGEWSRDGKRILFMSSLTSGPPAIVLADPKTMATKRVDLPKHERNTACIFMELVFTPDGKGISESVRCKSGKTWRADGIRTYDLTGKPTHDIPATAPLIGPGAYSPDGTLLLLNGGTPNNAIVVDAATGAERSRIVLPGSAPHLPGTGIVGWYDSEHLAVYAITNPYADNAKASLLVVDLTGATVETIPMPVHEGALVMLGTVRD